MTIRRRLVIRGRVQGVFFRDATRREAEAQGVAGWVRNVDDGTVEAVLEGDEAAVTRVAGFCRRGPSQASVAGVDASDEAPEGLSGFEVR